MYGSDGGAAARADAGHAIVPMSAAVTASAAAVIAAWLRVIGRVVMHARNLPPLGLSPVAAGATDSTEQAHPEKHAVQSSASKRTGLADVHR